MTVSSPPPEVKDNELVSFGLVESASVNKVAVLKQTKFNESELTAEKEKEKEKEKDDFTNTFICHLIFYVLFCISLVLHILIDLGLGAFVKNKFSQLFAVRKKTVFDKGPAFA